MTVGSWIYVVVVLGGTLLACLALLAIERSYSNLVKRADDKLDTQAAWPFPSGDLAQERFWAYYELQYERVAAFETARLQVTSFVVAGSLVALGLFVGGNEKASLQVVSVAGLGVIVVNLLAMAFSTNSRYWVKRHQARAEQILEALSVDGIQGLQARVDDAFGPETGSSGKRRSPLRSNLLLIWVHVALAMAAATMLAAQVRS